MTAADWDRRYGSSLLVWSTEPNRFVAEATAALVPGSALDVAAGEGRNAVWLAGRGWRVTAVDFSAVGLDKGRALAREHGVELDWVVADVTEYHPAERACDLVVVAYLQLPAGQLGPVLRRAAAAVAPGGTLVFVGHDRTNLVEGVGGPQTPEVLHTVDEVVGALGALRLDRAERVHRPVEVDGTTRYAVDTLVTGRRL